MASVMGRGAACLGRFGNRRPALSAMILGALAALALPPVHILPVLLISFPGLVWLIDRASSPRRGFFMGWWWGFGHFSASLYWIAHALLTDPARFGWMIPFAVFGLAAVLGVFTGLATLAARLVKTPGIVRVLVLAGAWAVFEWLRGWVLTGFAWNLIATVWLPILPVAQLAALVGAYGVAIPTVAAAAMPALLAKPSRRHAAAVLAAWAVLAAAWGWGAWRIPADATPTVPGVRLRLVQGNVAQTAKWQPELRARHLLDYVALSSQPGRDELTAVIWPETAVPYFIDGDDRVRAVIASAAPPNGLVVTGAPRTTPQGQDPQHLWNSLEAVTSDGTIAATFDKVHLVPFGEYVPLRGYLPITKITAGGVDFTAGDGLVTLDLPGLPPVSPTICYEDIFPGRVVADGAPRPAWLLNVTNDGWFGNSAGPYQHFAAARLRAIEEGLPMVRAANTGITGFVDPYGRVTGQLPLGEQGIVDGALPVALATPPLFARYGNGTILLLLFVLSLIALIGQSSFALRDERR